MEDMGEGRRKEGWWRLAMDAKRSICEYPCWSMGAVAFSPTSEIFAFAAVAMLDGSKRMKRRGKKRQIKEEWG